MHATEKVLCAGATSIMLQVTEIAEALIDKPTPVFLPGKSYGRRSLVGYSPRGRKESDMTEQLHSLTSLSHHLQ